MHIIRDRPRDMDLDAFLARPLFAHLATASPDGPRESPVWFLWEDAALWIIGSRRDDTFPARLDREPACALGIVDFEPTRGLVQHVGVRGRAVVVPFDRERARRLLRRYIGTDEARWNPRFRATLDDAANILIRVIPETVVVRDVSYTI